MRSPRSKQSEKIHGKILLVSKRFSTWHSLRYSKFKSKQESDKELISKLTENESEVREYCFLLDSKLAYEKQQNAARDEMISQLRLQLEVSLSDNKQLESIP